MKSLLILFAVSMFASVNFARAQAGDKVPTAFGPTNPWTADQLVAPTALAQTINSNKTAELVIINIGAVEDIKGAMHIGPVNDAQNLKKMMNAVATTPKNAPIIIYCGCCPFAKCPNIRPAFSALKKAGFTNVKLLDLPKNLQTNWIAEGYPLAVK